MRITTRQIREVTRASRKIATGDLTQNILLHSHDEAGELGKAFNEMAGNIRKLIESISAEQSKLDTVLSNMTDGVIVTDNKGNISLANHTAEKLFAEHGYDGVGMRALAEEAKVAAEKVNGVELGGRQLTVNEARPKEDRPADKVDIRHYLTFGHAARLEK